MDLRWQRPRKRDFWIVCPWNSWHRKNNKRNMRFLTLTPRIKLPLLSGFSLGMESIANWFLCCHFYSPVICATVSAPPPPSPVKALWSQHVRLTSTTCSEHFPYKGAWNNICHYIKEGVIAKCSWKSSNNGIVLNAAVMKRNRCEMSEPFSKKTKTCSVSFLYSLTVGTLFLHIFTTIVSLCERFEKTFLLVKSAFLVLCWRYTIREGCYGVEFSLLKGEKKTLWWMWCLWILHQHENFWLRV